jgi:phenylpropionate dioxygenase-like ring-hydroxylating dioxygenase large terminal subunit
MTVSIVNGNGAPPILRTRVPSADLRARFDALEADLKQGLVPAWVFGNDPEVYALERERLFPRAWTFVGHESEIPDQGDHLLRYVGEDSFILVRGSDDQVRLLFNACRHRGSQVCAVERGNSKQFQCPYHGWTYANTGDLLVAPAQSDTIGGLDRGAWGLLAAPRLEKYHGFYFACLDPDAPSLADYLGHAAYYLDIFFALFDDLEVCSAPQRYTWPTSWKAGFDGFGDDYHLITLHPSLFEISAITIPYSANILGHHVIAGGGHNITISIAPSDETALWGYPSEVTDKYSFDKLDDLQADLARRSRVLVGTVFPNFSFLIIPLTGSKDQPATAFAQVRLWQPRGEGKMEAWSWNLVPKSASAEFREQSHLAALQTFGSSGVFDQDDGVTGRGMNLTSSSIFGRGMKLNYQAGLEIGTAAAIEDWPGPGLATSHRYEENSYRYTLRQWSRFVMDDAYPEILPPPNEFS